ncbi:MULTISPECIES: DNA primase [unclassified Streptomyces]|uniref:DNA primase n=1 Tax=unclassified Streptomyces TaxID=2593676 RepID=UPI00248237F7|nr:DNA primase [Streptomyces sp. ATE26]MDI1455061.1 DNA primase [Streptomyces sp. ATE26]
MNRTGLGLAIGAGYLLGRTKKLKMALAVGSLVAGKKLNLGPRGLAELLNQQLRDNPQFKEIGDQLRQDLRGVGKAATGAMAERQMSALADRLHGRTSAVRDQLSGVVPGGKSESEEPEEQEDEDDGGQEGSAERKDDKPRREAAAKKAPAKKSPAKKTAAKSTAGRTAAKKAAGTARRTATKKTAAAGGGNRTGRSRQSKGGEDR